MRALARRPAQRAAKNIAEAKHQDRDCDWLTASDGAEFGHAIACLPGYRRCPIGNVANAAGNRVSNVVH